MEQAAVHATRVSTSGRWRAGGSRVAVEAGVRRTGGKLHTGPAYQHPPVAGERLPGTHRTPPHCAHSPCCVFLAHVYVQGAPGKHGGPGPCVSMPTVTVARSWFLLGLLSLSPLNKGVLVTGPAASGKSQLVRRFVARLAALSREAVIDRAMRYALGVTGTRALPRTRQSCSQRLLAVPNHPPAPHRSQ